MSSAPSTARQTVSPIRPAAPATATRITAATAAPACGRPRPAPRRTAPRRGRCRPPTAARAPTAPRRARARSSSVTASIRSTTSSSDSSGAPASTSEPSRFMRAPVDSSASTTRPLRFSLARVELLAVAGSSRSRSSSAADDRERLLEVVGPRPDVQADLAGVLVGAGERVDGVGEPAPLADLLEQARGGGAAEDRVEHAQREPALVVAREAGAAEADVVLLGVLALEAPCARGLGTARTATAGAGPRRHSPGDAALRERDERVVVDRARRPRSRRSPARSGRRGRRRSRRPACRRDHRGAADDRPAERVIAEHRLAEHVEHLLLRVVLVHRDLLEDHRALGVDVARAPGGTPCRPSRRTRRRGARRSRARRPRSSPCRCRR